MATVLNMQRYFSARDLVLERYEKLLADADEALYAFTYMHQDDFDALSDEDKERLNEQADAAIERHEERLNENR